MADEPHVVMTVECSHCKIKQKVHVAASADGAQVSDRTIQFIRCDNHFKVTVANRTIRGPFPP